MLGTKWSRWGAAAVILAGVFGGGMAVQHQVTKARGDAPLISRAANSAPGSVISALGDAVSAPVLAAPSQGAVVTLGEVVTFYGACDASGGVPMSDGIFSLADDEDNIIRIYDANVGGPPLRLLHPDPKVPAHEEADLEAATSVGGDAYWLSSHGRNKKGKIKAERLLFFSTKVPTLEGELEVVGEPYSGLVEALLAEPSFSDFNLATASQLAPKNPGGLNIEGMTATPDGQVLLGFRNPIPYGRALLLPLENPSAIPWGDAPKFGAPQLLDLGGLGVRALSWWRGHYFIVAGHIDSGVSRLFRWKGPGSTPEAISIELGDFNPEGFFTPESRDKILLLSDDGTVEIEGVPCKKLEEPEKKRFRGVWVSGLNYRAFQ